MLWNEKPPMLTGISRTDIYNLRDYLVRLANRLEKYFLNEVSQSSLSVSYGKDGQQILKRETGAKTEMPLNYVLTTTNSADPASYYGGAWSLLGSTQVNGTTVYYYRKTG